MKTIVLLETSEQVKDLLLRQQDLMSSSVVIALSPYAMYELERNNVGFKVLEDYYKSDDLYQEQILNYSKIEELCNHLDKNIGDYYPEISSISVKPASFSIRHILTIYTVVFTRVFQISQLINIERPDTIYCYDTLRYPFGPNRLAPFILFDNRESIYSDLLSFGIWEINTIFLSLPANMAQNVSLKLNRKRNTQILPVFKNWLLGHPVLYSYLFYLKKNGLMALLSMHEQTSSLTPKPILMYGAGYSWDDSIDNLLKSNLKPIFRTLNDFDIFEKATIKESEKLISLWNSLLKDAKFRSYFLWDNLDFFPVMEERFEYIVKNITPLCCVITKQTIEKINKQGIKAVIASTLATPIANSVACAAHLCEIPVVTWQHGGYGSMKFHPFVSYLDLMNSDEHLVFGDGVHNSLKVEAERFNTKVEVVGSMSIEKQMLGGLEGNTSENIILYATDAYLHNSQYVSTFPPFSDVLLWKTQKQIIDQLSTYKDYTVIIKLHPSQKLDTSPVKKYICDKGFDNFKIIGSEQSFLDLIVSASLIILDRPFTTLLQALVTSKPVFAFTGLVHYNEVANKLLSRRAICEEDISIFLHNLDKYLSENHYDPDLLNTDFLIHYGHPLNKNSGDSAIGYLRDIIKKFEEKKTNLADKMPLC